MAAKFGFSNLLTGGVAKKAVTSVTTKCIACGATVGIATGSIASAGYYDTYLMNKVRLSEMEKQYDVIKEEGTDDLFYVDEEGVTVQYEQVPDVFKDAVGDVMVKPTRNKILKAAAEQLGHVDYLWGGNTAYTGGANGKFDCSGFVSYCYAAAGVNSSIRGTTNYYNRIIQSADAEWYQIDLKDALPGDLLLCKGHVMMFISLDSNGNLWVIDCGGGGEDYSPVNNNPYSLANGGKSAGTRYGARSNLSVQETTGDSNSWRQFSNTGTIDPKYKYMGDSGRSYIVVRSKALDKIEQSESYATVSAGSTYTASGTWYNKNVQERQGKPTGAVICTINGLNYQAYDGLPWAPVDGMFFLDIQKGAKDTLNYIETTFSSAKLNRRENSRTSSKVYQQNDKEGRRQNDSELGTLERVTIAYWAPMPCAVTREYCDSFKDGIDSWKFYATPQEEIYGFCKRKFCVKLKNLDDGKYVYLPLSSGDAKAHSFPGGVCQSHCWQRGSDSVGKPKSGLGSGNFNGTFYISADDWGNFDPNYHRTVRPGESIANVFNNTTSVLDGVTLAHHFRISLEFCSNSVNDSVTNLYNINKNYEIVGVYTWP